MSTIKKADGIMTTDWQETANEIIKGLFLEDNEVVVDDTLPITEESVVKIHEIKRSIDSLNQTFIKTKQSCGSRRNQSRNISEDL